MCHEENTLKASVFFRHSLRRKHPLLRVAVTVLAFVVLGFASVFVLMLALGVLGVWAAKRGWQQLRGGAPKSAAAHGSVIDAEYRVVGNERSRLASR